MGFIETSYGGKPNLSDVNIDSALNMGSYGILTSGGMDLENSDLIGVKRFLCQDYLGALITGPSDVLQEHLYLNDVAGAEGSYRYTSKKFRIPSNFVAGSQIRVVYYAQNTTTSAKNTGIYLYDNDLGTYTVKSTKTTNANTSEWVSVDLTVNAGELYGLYAYGYNMKALGSSQGVKMCYDTNVVTGSIWEVITP